MRRMITGGLGFRRGWLFTGGYGVGGVALPKREILRLISMICQTMRLVSRVP